MADEIRFLVAPMTRLDVPRVAELHTQVFPGYFLTRLGKGILETMYDEFVVSARAWPFVCKESNEIVGFVVGVRDLRAIKKSIAIKRWTRVLANLTPQLAKEPSLVIPLAQRLLPSLQPWRRNGNSDLNHVSPSYLLSIGVAEKVRGTQAASLLTQALFGKLETQGLERVALYTRVTNERSRAFFEKVGFRFVCITGVGDDASVIYERELHPTKVVQMFK